MQLAQSKQRKFLMISCISICFLGPTLFFPLSEEPVIAYFAHSPGVVRLGEVRTVNYFAMRRVNAPLAISHFVFDRPKHTLWKTILWFLSIRFKVKLLMEERIWYLCLLGLDWYILRNHFLQFWNRWELYWLRNVWHFLLLFVHYMSMMFHIINKV